jgi:uncharacterized protein YraI
MTVEGVMDKRTFSRIGHLLAAILAAALVLLALGPAPAASAQGVRPVACVTAYRLNVRSGPGVSYPFISGLSRNQCVTLTGYRNAEATWVQVELPTGGSGWVSVAYITTSYPIGNLAVAPGPAPANPAPPATPDWRGEYFANRDLVGSPALVRNDQRIDFDWDLRAPIAGLPADNFSVRWTRSAQFDGATYRFRAVVDDGVRLWVDGQLILNSWMDGPARELVVDYPVSQGSHNVRVEYYERAGFASVRLWWERVSSPTAMPDWKGEYYTNRDLLGFPALVRNEQRVEFNWGLGVPASGFPVDNFSARWTRTASFEGATYRFHAVVDDGVRLWVDDQRILDSWVDGPAREIVVDYGLSQGSHTVRVEYYEHTGYAQVRVWWDKVGSSFPDWKGEYFSNRKLEGSPALVRNDKKIEFNWKDDKPAKGLPKDKFSVRWTRTTKFDGATYRFYALVDDGVRLWVDDRLLIDAWQDGPARQLSADRALVQGKHTVRVEYYEREGNAQIHVWWEKITPTFAEWKGEYWSNRDLKGNPALVRNDKKIDFDWKGGSAAAGLPADNFSARWTREIEFEPGTYRFYARSDDGIRVYIDDERIIRRWSESDGTTVHRYDRTLEGKHTLRVEYFEMGGSARVNFWWEKR